MDGLNKVIDQFFAQKMRDGMFSQLGSEGGENSSSNNNDGGTVASSRDAANPGGERADSADSGGGSTVAGASFNFVNSIVGAGIIGIPFAIQQCGFVLGICMLTLVAVLIYFSVMMLVECGIKANRLDFEELSEHLLGWHGYYAALTFMFLFAYGAQVRVWSGPPGYPPMISQPSTSTCPCPGPASSRCAFGPPGNAPCMRKASHVQAHQPSPSPQVAYLVVVGDTVPVVAALFWPDSILTSRRAVIGLTSTLVVLPLCMLKVRACAYVDP